MYLLKKNVKGRAYLFLMKSVYVRGTNNPKKVVVKNYGPWDKLPEEFKKQYEDKKRRRLLTARMEREANNKLLEEACKMPSPREDEGDDAQHEESKPRIKNHALNYGHLAFKNIWEKELRLSYKIDYLQRRDRMQIEWKMSDLLFYLAVTKIIDPGSYLQAFGKKSDYFYCPWQDISLDNFYRGLDFIGKHFDKIIEHAVKTRLANRQEPIKVAFFDCTNTYFETPYDDLTWQVIHFNDEYLKPFLRMGYTREQLDEILESEQYKRDLDFVLKLQEDKIIRMRGPSKECRREPLVSVALAIDQTGFPIECKVFAGNLSELKTVPPVLKSLKDKYNVQDVYFVADRGLNSTQTLSRISDLGLGFLVAQKVSNQKANERKEMLDASGYRNIVFENGVPVESDEELDPDDFRFKSSTIEKKAYVPCEDGELTKGGNPKRKQIKLQCKIIYTWSPVRARRDKEELANQIAKARKAVENGELLGNPYGTGWRSLLKTQKEASQGFDKEQYRAIDVKEEVIKEREAVAGYAAYVWQAPLDTAEPLTDLQILQRYKKLVEIEDCFRVMKNNLSLRPMYVRLKDHICAHCYLCMLSLQLLRSLQEKLELKGVEMSSDQIISALKDARLLPMPSASPDNRIFLDVRCCLELYGKAGLKSGREIQALAQVDDAQVVFERYMELLKQGMADDTDRIFESVGLTPLNTFNTLSQVRRSLGLRTTRTEELISKADLKLLDYIYKMGF